MTPNPDAPGLPPGVEDLLGLGNKMAKLVLDTEETVRLREWVNLLSSASGDATQHAVHASFSTILKLLAPEHVRLSEIHKTWNMRLEQMVAIKVRHLAAV